MMGESLRQICALAVLCGVILQLTPSGGVKRVMSVLCASAMICAVLSGFQTMELDSYRLSLARIREREASLELSGAELEKRLNRQVIEEELRAYILDKAAACELEVREVQVALDWSKEGLWVPGGVSGQVRGEREALSRLEQILEAELGIPAEEQNWSADD